MTIQTGVVVGGVRVLLQLEGAVVTLVALVLFARTDASGWQFAALFLVPDLGVLGYLAGPRVGALTYNTLHTYTLPLALWVLAPAGGHAAAAALIWLAHIGFDRAVGLGLKYGGSFRVTHLGELGQGVSGAGAGRP